LGSVTVNDAAFPSGSTTATLTETGAKLVATPNSGASFVAWVKAGTNEVISQSATYALKPYATSMNIQAVFTTATNPAYFMTGSILYNELNAAMTAAASGDKKVVTISSGTLATGTTYSISSDITLLVPYSTTDYQIDSSTVIDDSGGQGGTLENANMELVTLDAEGTSNSKVTAVMEPNTSVLYTLTIPAGTTVNVSGKLVVGGALVAGTNSTTGVCGATGGAHSNIQMDGAIYVKNGGVLSTCGYILGNGTITAESGGKVYQPFILLDHKDGHYLYAAKENDRWPIYRYSIQNIRCPLVLNTGSDMYGYSAVFTRKNTFAAARFNPSVVNVVGSGSDSALFLVNGTSMTMNYADKTLSVTSSSNNNSKGYYSKVGRTTMTFNGDAALGSVELSVVVMGSNYNMSSANSEVPIPYNFQLVQKSGTFNVANNMALLPGSTFTVNSGAAMTVASGKSLVVYDGLRDYATRSESVTLDGGDETGGTWPLYHYPTSDNLQSGGFSRTADLIINGTLTVNGNLGGTVQTNGTTGKIIMGASAGNTATGTFGVQNETTTINVIVTSMTIAGSCGKTEHELTAQVFTANSTTPIQLVAGKHYVASGTGTNTLTTYTYSVFGTHNGSATTESKSNLNATVTGTWCAVEIAATNIAVRDALDMYFYVHKAVYNNISGYTFTVTKGNNTKTIDNESDWITADNSNYYRFCFSDIAAKEMCDTIRVSITYNGTEIYVLETSVQNYAKAALEILDASVPEQKNHMTALVDMLNYGAAAQTYYGYNDQDLASATMSEEQKALGSTGTPDVQNTGSCDWKDITETDEHLDNWGSRLQLINRFGMHFTVDGLEDKMTADIFDANGNALASDLAIQNTRDQHGRLLRYFTTEGTNVLSLIDAEKQLKVVILKDGFEYCTIYDSVESYIARMIAGKANYSIDNEGKMQKNTSGVVHAKMEQLTTLLNKLMLFSASANGALAEGVLVNG